MSLLFTQVPDGVNIEDDQQPSLYVAYSLTISLAVVAVALRWWCRLRLSNAGIGWDDWLVLSALVFAIGQFAAMIVWVKNGLGRHIYLTGYEGFVNFLKVLFGIEILYTLSIMFTKYSILAFYWRIFGKKNMKLPTLILAPVVTCWGVGVILTSILQCTPVSGFWDKSSNPTCGVDTDKFFIGNAVPNILTDWALLFLPIPFIWRLQRDSTQKLALVGVFALGGFICLISIVRLAIQVNAYRVPSIDLTWVFIGPSTWTAVETNIGVVSACLPSLRPVLNILLGKDGATSSTGRKTSSNTQQNRVQNASLNADDHERGLITANSADSRTFDYSKPQSVEMSDITTGSISVKTTVSVHTETV